MGGLNGHPTLPEQLLSHGATRSADFSFQSVLLRRLLVLCNFIFKAKLKMYRSMIGLEGWGTVVQVKIH